MISYDSIDDFVLYPGHEAYNDIMAQQQGRQENVYGNQQYTLDDQFVEMGMTTYDSYASVTAPSSAPTAFYDAPQFVVDAPQETLKLGHYRYTPPGSPSNSASHSFDHPPSTMSSTSGASVRSANSSAVGSPYSRSTHTISSREPWTESGYGLGLGPSIVSQDSFCQSDFVSAGLEHEVLFAPEKLPSGFVGECTEVPSSQGLAQSAPFSSSISNNFRYPFPHTLAVNTSVAGSGGTPGIKLHEAKHHADHPMAWSSGESTRSTSASPSFSRSQPLAKSSPQNADVFRSPSTPASATSSFFSRARSPALVRGVESRRQSVVGAGIKKPTSSPKASPGRFPHGRPTPPPSSPSQVYAGQFQTPFFSQSSGNFIAPLESSCWFSYTKRLSISHT